MDFSLDKKRGPGFGSPHHRGHLFLRQSPFRSPGDKSPDEHFIRLRVGSFCHLEDNIRQIIKKVKYFDKIIWRII